MMIPQASRGSSARACSTIARAMSPGMVVTSGPGCTPGVLVMDRRSHGRGRVVKRCKSVVQARTGVRRHHSPGRVRRSRFAGVQGGVFVIRILERARPYVVVCFVVAVVATMASWAGPVAAADHTFAVAADAHVRSNQASKNYGRATTLQVRAGNPEY